MALPASPLAQPTPRRIVAVVLDAHADAEALVREAAWIVRERAGELRLFLRREPIWRLWFQGSADKARIQRLADRWNATLTWWQTEEELNQALRESQSGRVTDIVLGPRRNQPWQSGLGAITISAIGHAADSIQARITYELGRRKHYTQVWQDFEWRIDQQRPWFHEYVLSAFAVSIAALAVKWIGTFLPGTNLSAIFLAAVVYSASAYGLAAALFTSLFSIVVVEFFFVAPRFSVSEKMLSADNVLLLFMFVVVAVITSNLATRLRNQARRAERQAIEARALFQLTRDIAVAADTQGIFAAIVRQSEYLFECDAVLLTPFQLANVPTSKTQSAGLQVAFPTNADINPGMIEAAREAFADALNMERAEKKLSNPLFFPLISTDGPVAILMLNNVSAERMETDAFRRLVESLCRIAAIAVERTMRKQELENTRVIGQTEKLRSALLSAIAHDFGTPLASIIGSASSLVSYGATYPADVINELLTTIMEEAERLNRFVKNVLQMNKLESGVLTPRFQWADAGDLVGTALDASHRRLQNHEVFVDIAERLPLVHVDFVLMENVLVNLLDNAAKYAAKDSDIQIVVRNRENTVAIDVTDQGRGIPSDELGAVFDKFYRAKQRDRTVPGTGLGLAICKGIVEAHEGTIEALSQGLGHGTTIRVRLPIREPDDAAMAEV
jgi:two-component system, OmpR family, sensor histidine kinase KdpD